MSWGIGEVILMQHWSTTKNLADSFIFTSRGVDNLSTGLLKAVELLTAEIEKAVPAKKAGAQSQRANADALANNSSSFYFLMARGSTICLTRARMRAALTAVSVPVFNSVDFSAADFKSPNKVFLILKIVPQSQDEVPAVTPAPVAVDLAGPSAAPVAALA